jgi:hypothetical protein
VGSVSLGDLADEVMGTLFQLAADPATDIRHFTRVVLRELRFRTGKMPTGIPGKLRTLEKKLTGYSFWEHLARYVLNTTWYEDDDVSGNTGKQRRQPSQRVRKLAAQVAQNPSLFSTHLPQFVVADGYRLYEFGVKLAGVLCSQETVEAVLLAQLCALPEMQTQFISGYFSGLQARFPDLWETSMVRLLEDDTSRDLGVAMLCEGGISETILRLLLKLLRQGHVQAAAFRRLAWQAKAGHIPQVWVEEILAALVHSVEDAALQVAIQLAYVYFFDKENPRTCDENLVFRFLSADQVFGREQETMTAYYWHVVAEGFRERFPGRELELLSGILAHPEYLWSTRSSRGPGRIADEIVRRHPNEAWTIVSTLLESNETPGLVYWLGDEFGIDDRPQVGAIRHFDPDVIMAWVLQNPEARVRKLLRCLPKTLDEKDGGKLTKLFLEAFGDHENAAGSLIGHFLSSDGWVGSESA